MLQWGYIETWCKIWRGIDLSFQNWHKEFDEFWPEHSKVSKACTLMGSFQSKHIMFELKKYRGVMCHGNEKWCKISKRNWLVVLKLTREIWQILTQTPESLKHLHFNGFFLIKVYMFERKKYRGVTFDGTEN